jgi:hypothetical protein
MANSEETVDFFMGVYKFSTNVGTISKFFAPEGGHEASSTEDLQISCTTLDSRVTMVTWFPGFVQPCFTVLTVWGRVEVLMLLI